MISLFLPDHPLFWYIDVGCEADPEYPNLSRSEIFEERNAHLARLLIMNAKHVGVWPDFYVVLSRVVAEYAKLQKHP